MSCGLPVVATDVGDTRHIVSPDNGGWIVPGGEPFFSALAQMAGDVSLRRAIGPANRNWAAERYSLTRMLQAYETLYRRAIETG
jgi:glycosyltransferase involved in cell wall biosynthesis